jgi:hypothetical protein
LAKISKVKLRQFFANFAAVKPRLPKAHGNLYEFYVFLEVCASARRAGFNVRLIASGSDYRVRASPGSYGGHFGYALLDSPPKQFELHNGIELRGNSLMEHEADILLIDAAPAKGKQLTPRLVIECKLYESAARLKGEVRKAVGAVLDWSRSSHPTRISGRSSGCIHCGLGFEACFVTNVRAGLRRDIENFLTSYEVYPAFDVLAGAPGLTPFSRHIENILRAL